MLYNLNKEIFVSEVSGMKVYMEMERDNASMIKKAGFMVYIPNVGFSKRFTIPMRTLVGKAPADMFLNLGFGREDVEAIADAIRNNLDFMDVTSTGESVGIEMVHKVLTQIAMIRGYLKEIDGKEHCAIPIKEFRSLVKEMDFGYRSHLEILQNFRMLRILRHNVNRLDYRTKASEARFYCFIPAEGVTETTDVWDEGTVSALPTADDSEKSKEDTRGGNYAA